MIVVLWNPNSLTRLAKFSFSLNLLKSCPWWYATFIIPLLFLLIISSYRLIIFAASSGSYVSSASLFKSSNSTTSSMVIEYNNCFFISSFDRHFAFLLSAKPFHIYKQKNKHFSTKYKTKMFIKANFFCRFISKKLPHLQPFFLFHIFLLRYYQ